MQSQELLTHVRVYNVVQHRSLLLIYLPKVQTIATIAQLRYTGGREGQQLDVIYVIYTSRAYATMSVSVCLSVTEVHWRIKAN